MLERTGVLREIPRISPAPIKDLLMTAPAAFAALNGCVPTNEAAHFLIGECHKDHDKGFAGPLMTKDQVDSKWGADQWLPVPRFETVQASGKHRPIDDGKRFGHNSASGFEDTIECCSAFQPAVHARALAQQAVLQGCDDLLVSADAGDRRRRHARSIPLGPSRPQGGFPECHSHVVRGG